MNGTENIPQVWDDERDGQFFCITASLFTATYCYGASVLLAGYDPEDAFLASADSSAGTVHTQAASATAEGAAELRY